MADDAENPARKQRGRPFRRGESGNPNGKPSGTRNRLTVLAEALLDGQAEAITQKTIEMALAGDTTALRLCLERIIPPRRDRPIAFRLPAIRAAQDALRATGAITRGVTAGALTPSEAAELAKLVDSSVRAVEATELEQRVRALETAKVKR